MLHLEMMQIDLDSNPVSVLCYYASKIFIWKVWITKPSCRPVITVCKKPVHRMCLLSGGYDYEEGNGNRCPWRLFACSFTVVTSVSQSSFENFSFLIHLADLLLPCDHSMLMSITIPWPWIWISGPGFPIFLILPFCSVLKRAKKK